MIKYIEEWQQHLNNKNYSYNTIVDYIKIARKLFAEESIEDYEYVIAKFFDTRSDINSTVTIDKYVAVLNKFQEFLVYKKYLVHPLDLNYLYKSKRKKINTVEILTDEEVKLLLSTESIEDKLAMTILLDTGIRIGEFDFFNNIKDWINKPFIKVKGKSKEERIIKVSDRMNELAKEFKEKKIWPDSYTGRAKRVKQLAREFKLPKLTAHTFRHTFATNWIYNGLNPYILTEALGHTSLNQLTFYIAKNQKALLEEWSNYNAGKNNHDIEALKSEIKYYKLENKRLTKLLEEVE